MGIRTRLLALLTGLLAIGVLTGASTAASASTPRESATVATQAATGGTSSALAAARPACPYYHMCLYSSSGALMYDLYYCRDYYTPGYWTIYHNNQTPGTVAAFKNNAKVTIAHSERAPSIASYDSRYVYYVKPC